MALSKEEKFIRVQECALEILASGRDQLSVSGLARQAKVSRPWIYKNFGSRADSLLHAAAKYVGERFAGLGADIHATSLDGLLAEFLAGAERTLDEVDQYPWIPKIYFDFLGDAGPMGEAIRAVEVKYSQRTVSLLSRFHVPPAEAKRLTAASVKIRLAVAHAWVRDPEFRKLGKRAAAQIMMSPLSGLVR